MDLRVRKESEMKRYPLTAIVVASCLAVMVPQLSRTDEIVIANSNGGLWEFPDSYVGLGEPQTTPWYDGTFWTGELP